MTCIVALEQDGIVYLGGDSVAIAELDTVSRADEKVFLKNDSELAIGFSGSFRMGQLLRYALNVPEHKAGVDDMAYFVTDFIDAVRALFKEKGFLKRENDEESQDGSFVVGYRGKLYVIDNDFQVERPSSGYASIGSGAMTALGAMYATKEMREPVKRIGIALAAASEYNAGVKPPFTMLHTQRSIAQPMRRKRRAKR